MKWWLRLLLVVRAAGVLPAADMTPPDLSLRINGHAAAATPLILWQGEPIQAEVGLRQGGSPGAGPLILDPPAGGWFTRITVGATSPAQSEPWPLVVVGQPSKGALALQPKSMTKLVLRLNPAAAAEVPNGPYELVARLNLADGRGWRGAVTSDPFLVEVREAPAVLAGRDLGQRQLGRVRDALMMGDSPAAKAATAELMNADFHRPEGFVATALVFAAEGKRRLALLSIDRAIALASGVVGPELPASAAITVSKSIPFEYYDLRRRIEQMRSTEAERGSALPPPIATARDATSAPDAPTLSLKQEFSSPLQVPTALSNPTASNHDVSRPTPALALPPQPSSSPPGPTSDRRAETTTTANDTPRPPALPLGRVLALDKITRADPAIAPSPPLPTHAMKVEPADQGARDPKDFPRPDRSVRRAYSSVWQKTHSQETVRYDSPDTWETIADFYVHSLSAAGWEIFGRVENNQAAGNKRQTMQNWKMAARTAAITIVQTSPTQVEITISLAVRSSP